MAVEPQPEPFRYSSRDVSTRVSPATRSTSGQMPLSAATTPSDTAARPPATMILDGARLVRRAEAWTDSVFPSVSTMGASRTPARPEAARASG